MEKENKEHHCHKRQKINNRDMKGRHNNMPIKTKKKVGLAVVSHTGKGYRQ